MELIVGDYLAMPKGEHSLMEIIGRVRRHVLATCVGLQFEGAQVGKDDTRVSQAYRAQARHTCYADDR